MKRIPTFVAGMLTAAVIGGLGVGALAASGAVSFNASALQLNGQQISAKGENYTLASGQQVPASITYTDETGGGTTYLPVRRIADLLGIDIGWDSAAGAVTVKGEPATPEAGALPTNVNLPTTLDSYEDFKAFWTLHPHEGGASYSASMVAGIDNNSENKSLFKEMWNSTSKEQRNNLMRQFLDDVRSEHPDCEYIGFIFNGGSLGGVSVPDTGFMDVRDAQ